MVDSDLKHLGNLENPNIVSYLAYVNLHLIGIHKIFSENFQI